VPRHATQPDQPSLLGRYVRARRESRNLGQVELAELVGCSHAYISQLETKRNYLLNKRFIRPLANALGVPIDVILQLDGLKREGEGEERSDQQEAIAFILQMTPEQLRMVRPVLRGVVEGDEQGR
jgi:transcriptional regulator with XRE-family HTH domain